MKNKLMLAITKIGDLLLENKITSLEEEPEWKDIYLDIRVLFLMNDLYFHH